MTRTALVLTALALLLQANVAPAPAQSAPAATTGVASSVTKTGARVRGTVDANGEDTIVRFEYGETTGYGQVTPDQTATGTSSSTKYATIGGLQAGREYHYRIVASNSSGTTHGEDRTFTTDRPRVPYISARRAETSLTRTTVTAQVRPDNEVVSAFVEYGTTDYTAKTPPVEIGPATGPFAVTIPGLEPGTLHRYRIVAEGRGGRRVSSGSFRTGTVSLTARSVVYGRRTVLRAQIPAAAGDLEVTFLRRLHPFFETARKVIGEPLATSLAGVARVAELADRPPLPARYWAQVTEDGRTVTSRAATVVMTPLVSARLRRLSAGTYRLSGRFRPATRAKLHLVGRTRGGVPIRRLIRSPAPKRFAITISGLRPGTYRALVTPRSSAYAPATSRPMTARR